MPRYDIPGRTEPTSVSLSWDGKAMNFSLPHETDDPVEIRLLTKHPGVQEVPAPGPPVKVVADDPVFESLPEVMEPTRSYISTSRKTSRKEV